MIFIISAHPEEDIKRLVDTYDLSTFITGIRGGAGPVDKVSFIKNLLAEKKLAPEEMVFVDDMNEIVALAENVGCWRIASTRGFCSYERLQAVRPDKVIRNLKGLQGFINLINHDELNRLKPSPPKT